MNSISTTNVAIKQDMTAIIFSGVPVVTTELLANFYGTDVMRLRNNHQRNKERFTEGKHYFKLEGTELKEFKNRVSLRDSVVVNKKVRALTLWTQRGAARHAKMLETDRAWDVFEQLEDFYFSQKESGESSRSDKTTVDDRTPLRSLVNRIMGKYGVTYQAVYKMVHREFGVNHIDELTTKQTAEAMEYLSAKVIEGEFISKDSNEQSPKKQSDDSRYYVRVIIRDSLMGTAIELSGEADSLRDAANGIATDLGFKPHAFTHVPVNKRVIRRLY